LPEAATAVPQEVSQWKFKKLPFPYPYFHRCINSDAEIKSIEVWIII